MDPREPPLPSRAHNDRALFDRIAKNYGRKDLLPAQREARRLRLEQTFAVIDCPPDAAVLEVGCGAGFAAEYLKGRYGSYEGFDHSSELIAFARERHAGPGVSFECAPIHAFQPSRAYDVAFMIGVLHHLEDPLGDLRRIAGFVKPGGWVLANEPQRANGVITMARTLRKRLDRDYSDEQVELAPDDLADMFRQAGLGEVRTRAQGLFSTPIAEVTLPLQRFLAPVSGALCRLDRAIERHLLTGDSRLAWNVIAAGRVPPRD